MQASSFDARYRYCPSFESLSSAVASRSFPMEDGHVAIASNASSRNRARARRCGAFLSRLRRCRRAERAAFRTVGRRESWLAATWKECSGGLTDERGAGSSSCFRCHSWPWPRCTGPWPCRAEEHRCWCVWTQAWRGWLRSASSCWSRRT